MPVGFIALSRYTKIVDIINGMGQVSGIPHDFLGYTAVVHACATHFISFNDGHLLAKLCSFLSDGKTATATSDNNDIIMLLVHNLLLIILKRVAHF